jgi:hypothetical protein
MKYFLALTCITLGLLASCTAEKGEVDEILPCDTAMITYTNTVQAIITTNCTGAPGCHNPGSTEGDMTTYENLMGKVSSGKFRQKVIVEKSMPPTGPLPEETILTLKCWLKDGAPKD